MALTFVNQVGAVEGMNQAAPGTLIPESFVRFSQDVLFDRAGLMRRRGPFQKFKMYNANNTENTNGLFDYAISGVDDERVLAVLSTYDPTGAERIGMLVDSFDQALNARETILRVFDNNFKYLGYEVLPFDVQPLSIVSAKPALGGGLWVSIIDDPADADTHFQFFWRGGYSKKTSSITGSFTNGTSPTENVSNVSSEHVGIVKTISVSTTQNLSIGQFVYATVSGSDYYLGTVKGISGSVIELEKRPFLWDFNITNNHGPFAALTISNVAWASNVCTITTSTTMLYEVGDRVKITITSGGTGVLNNKTYTITAVNKTANTFSFALTSNPGNPSGSVDMDESLDVINFTNIPLKFVSVRPYVHVHGRGLLTIADADSSDIISGTAGTSAEGHWQAANITGYNVYRASDNFYIGKVSSVTNNYSAKLWSDSGIKLEGEEYIMRSTDTTDLTNDFKVGSTTNTIANFAGLYTAVYAGYQWYGNFAQDDQNTNRVVFSAAHDREAVDLSLDAADSIIFPGKSKFRGLGSSSAGLLVFLEDRTYILRGNDRTNFSVEQLVPEGCLCASSIVEYGGGVFWAGKSGIMFFDGASVRNLTKDNLGLYYTDSLDVFNPEQDRIIGFIHKNNLIMHFTAWKSPSDPVRYEPVYAADWQNTDGIKDRAWDEFDPDFDYDDFFTENNTPIFWDQQKLNNPEESASTGVSITWGNTAAGGNTAGVPNWETTTNINKWGPLRKNTSMTFAVYLPTNAITTLSNMDPRGVTTIETVYGLKTIVGVNSVENISGTNRLRARLIDIHPVFDISTNGTDAFLIEKINIPYEDLILGPDFYLQSKHFTVGDPILKKWFQRIMLSMLLYDGAIRMDLIDDDDNDEVDINKKKHKNWEVFTEKGYTWDYLGKGEGFDFGVVFPKLTSPNKSSWKNVEGTATLWDELFTADFNRYVKRVSWRKASVGLRLYQLNKYKKPFNGVVTTPNRVEIQGFSIGFKPLRQGRV